MLTTIYVEIDDFNKKMKEDYKEELEELYQKILLLNLIYCEFYLKKCVVTSFIKTKQVL